MTGNCMTVTGETCGYWLGVKKTEKKSGQGHPFIHPLSLAKTKIKNKTNYSSTC